MGDCSVTGLEEIPSVIIPNLSVFDVSSSCWFSLCGQAKQVEEAPEKLLVLLEGAI